MTGSLVGLFIFSALVVAAEPEPKLGDVSDGSRSIDVHIIPLFTADPVEPEEVLEVTPEDEPLLPFSTRLTCGDCHSYEIINGGWHFNAADPNVPPGRAGEPWILADPRIATQIPLSYRSWPGTFRPSDVGLTAWQFIQHFGRHMPGGSVGEQEVTNPDEIMRQLVSGKLENNCLQCHSGDMAYDQAEYASQVARQNYRWAATGACGFASVSGSAAKMEDTYDPMMPEMVTDPDLIPHLPTLTYRDSAFDHKNQVFFDVGGRVLAERCYFCHSHANVTEGSQPPWAMDEDVHLTAGMTCVDCHRGGLEHRTIRGYEGEEMVSDNPLAATSTCEGCHLGTDASAPQAGRLGAPVPDHPGIPPIHFEKLTCTACHSGPWPSPATYRGKTSRAHALGTHNVNKSPDVLPHILYPVFANQQGIGAGHMGALFALKGDKIAPHKLIWPAFWGALQDGKVTPIALETVREIVGKIVKQEKLSRSGDWPSLTEQDIAEALTVLQQDIEAEPVYVCGGNLYQLDGSQLATEEGHPAAEPYMWPFAHNVRPAGQSLGVRRCEDCHDTDAPFFFGKIAVDSALDQEKESFVKMVDFQDTGAFYAWAFAFSFVFRPWLKVVVLASCAIIAAVLLLYALRALVCVASALIGPG
jgi:hypothetical protein